MDKKRSLLNIGVSIVFKFILTIGFLYVRRCLIEYCGNEINGLNSLYLSIIGFLAIAELGIGNAITFCMYKPIIEKDINKVASLYKLFKKLYTSIGIIIFIGGLAIMPFLEYLAKDYSKINVNMYSTFVLMLISTVLTYFYSAKTSLIEAYKDNYITTTIHSFACLFLYGTQVIVIMISRSFTLYLACQIVSVLLEWIITNIIAKKLHSDILITNNSDLDKQTKLEVIKNIKAMFMHKVGNLLVSTTDSMIISAFIGVVVLGKYSNYSLIASQMVAVISLFFIPLTAIIGHVWVEYGIESIKRYFSFFHAFNYIIAVVFFMGYFATIDSLVELMFGQNLQMSRSITIVITMNYFLNFTRRSTLLFRDATGTFYNDRWKPVVEGVLNIILSILLVKVLPEDYSVVGVIVATIITNLFICHIVEPYVLFKNAFKSSPKKFYFKKYI